MKKTNRKPGLAKAAKSRKADKRQNPSARVSHKAASKKSREQGARPKAKKVRRKRAPRAVPPPPRQVGLLDAIGEVMADVEELGSEMRQWADNMEEKFGSTQKYEEVSQAADTLENAAGNDPVNFELQSFLNDVKITIQDPTPKRRGYSRADRLAQSQGVLMDVVDALDTFIGDGTGPNETTAAELKDALDEIDSELQGVDFPGMF